MASCTGTRANGAALDTATVGTKTFTVDATDKAGNAAHQTVTYTVTYRICTVPRRGDDDGDDGRARIVVRICDAGGRNLSSAAIALTAVGVDGGGLPALGKKPAPSAFRFDARQGAYVYDVRAKGLTPGTHTLRFSVAGDPVAHDATFVVRRDDDRDDGDRD